MKKNILLCLVTMFLVVILLECAFIIYYLIKDGRYICVKDMIVREDSSFITNVTKGAYADTLFPHPYLAFVHRYNPKYGGLAKLNSIGLFGHEYPLEKKPGTFVILVTGGSVASQYAGLNIEDNYLEQELNEHYINDEISRFLVLNGGDGSWAQPQQFILFSLYSDFIDGVITLDGYNEHFRTSGDEFRFERPSTNFIICINQNTDSIPGMFFFYIDGKLHWVQKKFFIFRHSKFLYFVISAIRNKARYCAMHPTVRKDCGSLGILDKMFELPMDWNKNRRRQHQLDQYKHYIRMMKAIADSKNIKNLFLIQPCPAIGKKLTAGELNSVGSLSYKKDYSTMINSLLELKKENIPIHCLADVFEGYDGDIYMDPIHVNKEGNRIMNKRIISLLEQEWGLKRQKVAAEK